MATVGIKGLTRAKWKHSSTSQWSWSARLARALVAPSGVYNCTCNPRPCTAPGRLLIHASFGNFRLVIFAHLILTEYQKELTTSDIQRSAIHFADHTAWWRPDRRLIDIIENSQLVIHLLSPVSCANGILFTVCCSKTLINCFITVLLASFYSYFYLYFI